LNEVLYKIGLRLASIKYVRHAIDERAGLSEFRKPPTVRILVGMFLIAGSLAMGWPVIVALSGAVAIYFHRPLLALIGGPLYIMSHLCFIAGMTLCGEKYSRIFIRWATRCGVEKLLSFGFKDQRPESEP
jgi:hypothetical protein